jgi:hypothetical protein
MPRCPSIHTNPNTYANMTQSEYYSAVRASVYACLVTRQIAHPERHRHLLEEMRSC